MNASRDADNVRPTDSTWARVGPAAVTPPASEDDFGLTIMGNIAGLTALTIVTETSALGYDIENTSELLTAAFTQLTSSGQFVVSNNSGLTSLSAPLMASVSGALQISGNAALASLDLSAFVPADGQFLNLDGNALDAAGVNLVLARCVANAAYASGTVNLGGGTNAAPTGQGIIDAAALSERGVTVNTN
jgi:hypothetical protein